MKWPHLPHISHEVHIPEFTIKSVFLGVMLAILMTAANAYIGLYAGMTVSASIPAAVISMALLRGILRRGTVLENNIVQTIASSGEAIAAGIIFTVPPLVIVGVWDGFEFWPTVMIALAGGLLGIIFMIPMRRVFIVEKNELSYPEGVACAEVLKAGDRAGGFIAVVKGFFIGSLFKYFAAAIQAGRGTLEANSALQVATRFGDRALYFGCDISPALVGVGYIVKIEIALLLLVGGAISWLIAVPVIGLPSQLPEGGTVAAVWDLWSSKVRYLGVGAMLVGGIWSIISIRHGIVRGMKSLLKRSENEAGTNHPIRTEWNISVPSMIIVLVFSLVITFMLYSSVTSSWPLSTALTAGIAVLAFFSVAVSSYIVGIVGSSNNPVSGITICALLIVAAVFYLLGMGGKEAVAAVLCVAGVVCCAATASGDMAQDLKTGYIVGSTPRLQQVGQMLGVVVSAFIMAPILSLLHLAYGIGTGLRAPQATLFASITQAVFGGASLPKEMIVIGAVIGVGFILVNILLNRTQVKFRFHIMPIAVGMYLPLALTMPMLLGALVRYFAEKKGSNGESGDPGVLLSSGMIAGEAVLGIVIAFLIIIKTQFAIALDDWISVSMAITAFILVLFYLYRTVIRARRSGKQ